MPEYVLIGTIVFCASWVMGATGFGFALICVPLLSAVRGPKFAVPYSLLCGYMINVLLLIKFKGHIDLKRILPLVLGALPGVCIWATMAGSIEAPPGIRAS